jgi:hypothetical protein
MKNTNHEASRHVVFSVLPFFRLCSAELFSAIYFQTPPNCFIFTEDETKFHTHKTQKWQKRDKKLKHFKAEI